MSNFLLLCETDTDISVSVMHGLALFALLASGEEAYHCYASMDKMHVEDWAYRAEGNLHIIVANNVTKQVLRLLKCSRDKQMHEEQSNNEVVEEELSFIYHVAHPLMRNCRACFPVKQVPLTKEFLRTMSKKIEPCRPKFRLNKVIDHTQRFGILMPDFCQVLPSPPAVTEICTISVEIKPKQGFILVGHDKCKFSQFQRLKVQKKVYDRVSAYCPVDLFSGSKKRMKRAIKALVSDPQNNFRVFRNGEVIYSQEVAKRSKLSTNELFVSNVLALLASQNSDGPPSNSKVKEASHDFQDILCTLLLYPVSECEHDTFHTPQFCQKHNSIFDCKESPPCKEISEGETGLATSCTLGLLLSLQKLEGCTISEYYNMYKLVQKHLNLFPEDCNALSLQGPYDAKSWKDTVTKICEMRYCNIDQEHALCKLDVFKAASLLRQFLIATSFKDCSIIMSFQQKLTIGAVNGKTDCPITIKTRCGQEYWSTVALVDSDPKPASRIPEYYHSASISTL